MQRKQRLLTIPDILQVFCFESCEGLPYQKSEIKNRHGEWDGEGSGLYEYIPSYNTIRRHRQVAEDLKRNMGEFKDRVNISAAS